MFVENDYLPQLPKGWVWTMLGDIITLEYGKGLVKSKRDPQGTFPVYGSSGMVGRHSIPLVEKPCLIVGRKGAIGSVYLSKGPCWAIDTTYYVIPPEGLNLSFLFYLLSNIRLYSFDRSTAIPGLNRDDAYAIKIPLAPFPEQGRIVARVEELFTRLDAGVESLRKVKAQLRRYRQVVLKYAFEGKLTEEWRKTHKDQIEPAQKLLERIKQERKKNIERKYKELPPIDASELSGLPEGWMWAKIGDVCDTTSGGTPSRKNKAFFGGDIPWLKSSELNDKVITSAEETITESGLANSSAKIFPKGTLLIALYGATAGKLGLLEIDAATNQAICAIFTPSGVSQKFLFWFLSSYRNEILMARIGGAQPNISQNILINVIIPIAPFHEQNKIVEEVETRFSVADEIEKVVERSLKQSERLHQSILKKAFEGSLVPQDPTDEPAKQLIERIKVESAKHEIETKKSDLRQMELMYYVK